MTPAHLGMRTRQLAWRWGLDLRVAHCCLEHAGQYSGPGARRPGPPGSPLLPITPSIGGSGEQTAGNRRPGTRAGPRAGRRDRRGQGHRDGVHPHPAPGPAGRPAGHRVDGQGPDERGPRAGPPAEAGRHRDRHARVDQRLLAYLVLRPGGVRAGGAAGQRGPGQEPARPAQNGQTGRDVAGPADRDGPAARLVRAAEGDPGPARLHPGPDPAGPGADPVLAAAGKAAGGRAGEGLISGQQADHRLGAGHDQGDDRRPARPGGAGRPGPHPDEGQARRPGPGPGRHVR